MMHISNIEISFGNSTTSPFSIEEYKKLIINNKEILRNKIKQKNSSNTYFLHQTHSIKGMMIKSASNNSLDYEGDFLITNEKKLSIGVLTADCLPVIFYDCKKNIISIAHAGWKGTVNNISKITFELMKDNFDSQQKDIQVIFAPSAKICCYEVSKDFIDNINPDFVNKTLKKRNEKYFFDIPKYNELLLNQCGISNINKDYNLCTICNIEFCSYRREKEKSGLQITSIMLK